MMKMKPYYIMPLAIILTACGNDDNGGETDVKDELPQVEISTVAVESVPQIKEYTANVEAENINNISPSAPNRIKSIAVEVGDPVRRGQTLVVMDGANITQSKINLDQIEREYNRAVQLLEIGAGTQQAVDQLKAQLDAARSQYDNLLENTQLISPINGVVTARNYDPGDMTGNQPVLTVGQLTPAVKVIVNISESDLALIRRGMPVDVRFDAFEGREFTGRIARIYPTVDPATRTFTAEIAINNGDGAIKPGMFARVSMNLGERSSVVVPDRAVVKQSGSGNKYVYVYSKGKVSYNRVELGRRLDNTYELLSGVADGDTVVISGQTRLADGVAVEIIK